MLTLVLLPGLDGTGELFAPFIKALNGKFPIKIIRYPSTVALGYRGLEALIQTQLAVDEPFELNPQENVWSEVREKEFPNGVSRTWAVSCVN